MRADMYPTAGPRERLAHVEVAASLRAQRPFVPELRNGGDLLLRDRAENCSGIPSYWP